jgi:segregation and condensation protein B
MEIKDIKKIIESLLFVSDKPLLTREIKAIIKDDLPEDIKVENILKEMQQEYVELDRAFELKFVADGWTFATKSEYSGWIKKLLKERTVLKLSPSAMEVLAIIAYKQPITRAEIDVIRGVDCGGVIDTLTDRKFIKIVGRKETLGRPLLYGTTQEFLRHFGLSHLSELPVIDTVKEILPNQEEKTQELPFGSQEEQTEQEQNSADNTEQNNQENQTEQEQVSEEVNEQQNQEQVEQEQNFVDNTEQNNQENFVEQEQVSEEIKEQQNQEQTEQEQTEQEQNLADNTEQNNQENFVEQEQVSEDIKEQQNQEQTEQEQTEQEQNFVDNTEQNNQENQPK